METMYFVLIGVAFFGLLVWVVLITCALKTAEDHLADHHGALENLLAFGRDAIEDIKECQAGLEHTTKKYKAICYGVDLIMNHLGLDIVHTPAKDEVVAIEKEQCCKKEKAK